MGIKVRNNYMVDFRSNDNLGADVKPEKHRLAQADLPLQVLDSLPDYLFRVRCCFSHLHRASVCAGVSHPS